MSRLRRVFFSLPNGLFLRLITFLWSWNWMTRIAIVSLFCAFFFCICSSFDVVRGVSSHAHAEACQGGVKSVTLGELFATRRRRPSRGDITCRRMDLASPDDIQTVQIQSSIITNISQQTPTIKSADLGRRMKNSSNHRSPAFDDAVKLSTFVCLTDVLHGCVINYVIKSQRDGSENYEILLNTSRDVSLYVRLVSANRRKSS